MEIKFTSQFYPYFQFVPYFSAMLRLLSITNYAIIDSIRVEFCDGVNIITGETGAGKSLLLGALALLLGERADSKVLYDTTKKCVLEAEFDSIPDTKELFEQHQLDFEPITIIRREIAVGGKSRAFVNDTPVNLAVLKTLGEKLVNMHSQHETLDLLAAGFQIEVIDTIAQNKPLLQEYKTLFAQYRNDKLRLENLITTANKAKAEWDYLQFQITELREANLEAEEQPTLEAEQQTLENVETIKRAVLAVQQLLADSDRASLNLLQEAQSQLKSVKNIHTAISTLDTRLASVIVELKDIAAEFEDIQDSTAIDPERLEVIQQRLTTIYRLQKKHSVNTTEALLTTQHEIELKIQAIDHSADEIEALQKQLNISEAALHQKATKLHERRTKVLPAFEKGVETTLRQVGMPNAIFKTELSILKAEALNETGCTVLRFLFSANKGYSPQEIKEVASGGELSRLMLSIKSQVATIDSLPTLVFDEIDSGISGEVALQVGEIMKQMSEGHQLICITHLPQIARIAHKHFYIYKETDKHKTHTHIKTLKGQERIKEIAKMLSGEKLSDAALANAKELVGTEY